MHAIMPQIKQIKMPDLRSSFFYKDIVSIFKNNKKNSLSLFSLSDRKLIFITHQNHYKRRKRHQAQIKETKTENKSTLTPTN